MYIEFGIQTLHARRRYYSLVENRQQCRRPLKIT
jgi:hypothetical protein